MKTTRTLHVAAIAIASVFACQSAQAAFHLWQIKEIYRNADGSVQFIELFTSSDSQQFLSGQTILLQTLTGTTLDTFSFGGNSSAPTGGHHLLIGTANIGTIYGVTPDFTYTTANFDVIGGADRRINFAGNSDIESIVDLPTNGSQSINGLVAVGNPARINAQASPTNFAGQTASIPEPATVGLVACGAVALSGIVFARRRRA